MGRVAIHKAMSDLGEPIAPCRGLSISEAIDWSSSDAIRLAVIAFSNAGYDVSLLEDQLPEDRDDYWLSLSSHIHLAAKLSPESAVDLLTDVNAHEEAAAFQRVLSGND